MPNLLHIPKWKTTSLGTPIELHASAPLADLRALKPILLIGGVHGDEPEGVRLASDTLQWLRQWEKDNTGAGKTLCPWILVPCLNVDGFALKTRVNGRGVDLNRNYPSKDWSKEARAERYFPGEAPGSEIEVQSVVELMQTYSPRVVIHCHSYHPCIVGTGSTAQRDTERLSRSSGYKGVDDIGYPTPGSLSSYGWFDHKIGVICIEEDDSITDYDTIWPRFEQGIREIFEDTSERT